MKRSRRHMVATLLALYVEWHDVPNYRLGQMIANAAPGSDPFLLEDDELLRRVTEQRKNRGARRAER